MLMHEKPCLIPILEESIFSFTCQHCDLDIPKEKKAELSANSGDSDQMLHSATSDLSLHCLPLTLLVISRLKWFIFFHLYIDEIRDIHSEINKKESGPDPSFGFVLDEESTWQLSLDELRESFDMACYNTYR